MRLFAGMRTAPAMPSTSAAILANAAVNRMRRYRLKPATKGGAAPCWPVARKQKSRTLRCGLLLVLGYCIAMNFGRAEWIRFPL